MTERANGSGGQRETAIIHRGSYSIIARYLRCVGLVARMWTNLSGESTWRRTTWKTEVNRDCWTVQTSFESISCPLVDADTSGSAPGELYAFSEELIFCKSRDIPVGIVTGYWLNDRGVGVRSRYGQEFSLLYVVQTGSRVHPTSYPVNNGALCSRVKRPGHEGDHSLQTTAEVKKTWFYTFTPSYAFMA
jgi:hypothetical protein